MADDRTRGDWIEAFAARLGLDPPDEATVDALLDVAAGAAHASERTAAPVACWLLGRAGVTPSDALGLAREV